MMHSALFFLFWRRNVSVLLIASSLILFAIWTWAFFDNKASNKVTASGQLPNDFANINSDNSNKKRFYLLQRLISQANRALRYQRTIEQRTAGSRSSSRAIPVPAAAAFTGKLPAKNLGIVRFLKPTKSPTVAIFEASEQTLSLVARRKKAPVVGESYLFEEERLKILESQQRARNTGMEDTDYERMLSSAERQSQYEHELQRIGVPIIGDIGPEGPNAPAERLVHLDLKGAPAKLSFLKRLLPMLKTLGATGLLIEYEDMFPYTGVLQSLSAKNAYKADELKDFLETAVLNGLSIMPLIQTFGHLEFALKLQGFDHMRELTESPQSICPSKKDSISFLENMLAQVIEFHLRLDVAEHTSTGGGGGGGDGASASSYPQKFTHIHIGCDEVARMGECEQCRQRSRNEIFLTHVTTLAHIVRSRWPQLHVVIWDDMLRAMTLSEMQHSNIGSYVEPMIWVYANDIYHFIQPQLWDMYSKVFPTAWAASAFKGAFGESLMIPPLQQHLENNIRWLAVIAKEGGRFSKGFKGLALTGWQRYDHFAVLCELLPIGIPSLIVSLSTVSKGYFSTNPKDNNILRVLECAFHPDGRRSGHPWIELHPNSHHSQLFALCTYPGSQAYVFALRLSDRLTEIQRYLMHVHDKSAWMSDYNVRNNFSSPLQVLSLTAQTPAIIDELTGMAREAHEVLYEIFDEYTIAEFVEQNIYPPVSALRGQLLDAQRLLQTRVRPQRPLPVAQELIDWNLIPGKPAAADRDPAQLQAENNRL